MTATVDLPQDLIDRGMQLSPAARRKFAGLLLDGVAAGDPELKALLTRRWEDYQSGKTKAIPVEEAKAQLRAFAENLPK